MREGMTLSQARAIAPQIMDFEYDAAADARELGGIADMYSSLSPIVGLYDDQTIAMDLGGCEWLHGSFEELTRRAAAQARDRGFSSMACIAEAPVAARAFAQHMVEGDAAGVVPVLNTINTLQMLSALPAALLGIPGDAARRLSSMGIHTVGQLNTLPRQGIPARLGPEVLLQLDRALGRAPDPIPARHGSPLPAERIEFPAVVDRPDMILYAIQRMAGALGSVLEARALGARALDCSIERPDGPVGKFTIQLSEPRRSGPWLVSLLQNRFERVDLGAGVVAIEIRVAEAEKLYYGTPDLFDTYDTAARAGLGSLLDRLVARLGADSVQMARLHEDHRPAKAWRVENARITLSGRRQAAGSATPPCAASRPLHVYQKPIPVQVTWSEGGDPWKLHIRGSDLTITYFSGPEIIQSGWADGDPIDHEYWTVGGADGSRHWICRDRISGVAFAHGFYC